MSTDYEAKRGVICCWTLHDGCYAYKRDDDSWYGIVCPADNISYTTSTNSIVALTVCYGSGIIASGFSDCSLGAGYAAASGAGYADIMFL